MSFIKSIHTLLSRKIVKRGIPTIIGGTLIYYFFDTNSTIHVVNAAEGTPFLGDLTLSSVHVFFRHGARLPIRHTEGVDEIPYEKDVLLKRLPYTEIPHKVVNIEDGGARPNSYVEEKYKQVEFKGGCIAGQLTYKGREQAYEFGQVLRKLYLNGGEFLSQQFSSDEFSIRSTNIDRCISSLESVLAGLFGRDSFNANEPVKIPVCANKPDGLWETLMPNTHNCRALKDFQRDVLRELMEDKDLKQTIRLVNEKIGREKNNWIVDITAYRDVLVFRQTHGLPIPSWLLNNQHDIDSVSAQEFVRWIGGTPQTRERVLRLASGVALNDVLENFDKIINKEKGGKKMSLMSCHDSTLLPLLLATGCYDDRWPPYMADLKFELYEDGAGRHWVRALYCGKECIMKSCDKPIVSLEKFKEILKPYAITMEQMKVKCDEVHEFTKTAEGAMKNKGIKAI